MGTDCISFQNIPRSTRLFTDFLYHFEKVQAFYPRAPQSLNPPAVPEFPADRLQRVAAVLERQSRNLGASAATLRNVERLKMGSPVVITGQQVGLLGGPMFSLLKGLTVVLLAEQYNAVPIFWLATEDHDLEEVSFLNWPAGDHLETLRTAPPHIAGAPVGSVAFDDQIGDLLQKLEEQFAGSEVLGLLRRSYSSGEHFGVAFGKLYAQLFAEFGLILLDPSDPELHEIAQPVYNQALMQWKEVNLALRQREQELEAAGYHAQVKITSSRTLCFCLLEGVRTPVRHDGEGFVAGDSKFSEAQLIALTQRSPERFSPNVLLRPIVQDYLLPTLCYAGGPAEIAYFAQVEVVYRKLLGRVTPVVPRIFATLVESRQAKLLDRYQMKLSDVFQGPERVREGVAAHTLPEGIMSSFDQAGEHLEQALSAIREPLLKLDSTLAEAAENSGSKMRYQLQGLRDKATRAEARKNSETQHHADELSTLLYPNKDLQEREIGGIYFLLKHGMALIPRLKEALKTGCVDHQIVRL
ncbi:MAG TPA: bacillithiol biosynthesis cysteine-adding enzyme BshC [Candidatus Saccharimonadales bacterium]|nr:bacillithiol biosynthesis cysteine-adding enzyme BshC [Candidatus Saccharimonadales bacterium]